MKKQLLFVLAMTATLFTNTLSAHVNDFAATTVQFSAIKKSMVVNLGNTEKEMVSVVIEDEKGNVLMSEKVKQSANFIKRYNMTQLENGAYTMTVTKTTIRTIQPFYITKSGIVITELEKKEKFMPVVTLKDNKLDVNVLLNNFGRIAVNIYDNAGRILKQDKSLDALNFHKRYNLAQMPEGAYVVEVTAGDETFYHTVVK